MGISELAVSRAGDVTLRAAPVVTLCLSGPGSLGKRLAADFIRQFPQNSGIRTSRRKLGQVGESDRAG
jgi:hypothetical protein